MQNVIERVLSLHDNIEVILPEQLPVELKIKKRSIEPNSFDLSKINSPKRVVANIEKDLISQALQQSNWKLAKAARLLKTDPWKLRYKVKKLKMDDSLSLAL